MVGINKPFLEILPICINERTAEPERNSFSKSKISKVTFIIIVALSLFNINSKEHFIIRAHTCEGFEVHIQAILLALCRCCFFSTIPRNPFSKNYSTFYKSDCLEHIAFSSCFKLFAYRFSLRRKKMPMSRVKCNLEKFSFFIISKILEAL